jgi:hypothetical protein
MGEMVNAHRILDGILKKKTSLGRHMCKREHNIEMIYGK